MGKHTSEYGDAVLETRQKIAALQNHESQEYELEEQPTSELTLGLSYGNAISYRNGRPGGKIPHRTCRLLFGKLKGSAQKIRRDIVSTWDSHACGHVSVTMLAQDATTHLPIRQLTSCYRFVPPATIYPIRSGSDGAGRDPVNR